MMRSLMVVPVVAASVLAFAGTALADCTDGVINQGQRLVKRVQCEAHDTLYVRVTADGASDLRLVVRGPDKQRLCRDDSGNELNCVVQCEAGGRFRVILRNRGEEDSEYSACYDIGN